MTAAIIGALAGGLVALLVNFIYPMLAIFIKTKMVAIEYANKHKTHVQCRVRNRGNAPIKNAILYISLDIKKEDLCEPPGGYDSILKKDCFDDSHGLSEDRLCWSVRSPVLNPLAVDIYGNEAQVFSPCMIDTDMIIIPSEDGWPENDKSRKYRVCLKLKDEYTGRIKVVSESTKGIEYSIRINHKDKKAPVTLSVGSQKLISRFLRRVWAKFWAARSHYLKQKSIT